MDASYGMGNASIASIHLRNPRDLREKILEFIALQGVCKSLNAEITEEARKVRKVFILRRFALMRSQSLTTLFLRLCLQLIKF